MKKFSTYLLVMFMIVFWIIRIIITLASQLGKDFMGMVPINEPFEIAILFATLFLIPFSSLDIFVTNKSSPTNCILFPNLFVNSFQPSQSSSAKPSSIEYCLLLLLLQLFLQHFLQ